MKLVLFQVSSAAAQAHTKVWMDNWGSWSPTSPVMTVQESCNQEYDGDLGQQFAQHQLKKQQKGSSSF